MRIALAVAVMLLAGCAAKHQAANLKPPEIGKATEADVIALQGKQPIKSVVAPNGAKNDTFPLTMMNASSDAPNATVYVFGPDGMLRHIMWETPSGARFLLNEKTTDGVLRDEIVGPMPTVVSMTIRRVS